MKRKSPVPKATAGILAASALLAASSVAMAVPITTYSEASINSYTSVSNAAPDYVIDTTGAAVQLSETGNNNLAFTNGTGNYVIKNVQDNVFARAALNTGELKNFASLALGNNIVTAGTGVPLGVRNGSATATAVFADSFTHYDGSQPFIWTSGDSVQFKFGVTGAVTTSGTIPDPASYAAGEPKDNVSTYLLISVYKPGTLDLIQQLNANYSSALNQQIQDNFIKSDYWYFGTAITPYDVDPAHILAVDPTTPTYATLSFNPDGDFDWIATLSSTVFLDANLQNVSATLDFSHTVTTEYVAPAGTTVFSASGVFPNTLDTNDIPTGATSATPEPATAGLLALAVGVLASGAIRRRRA